MGTQDKGRIDIAVIGVTQTGKSTWIASLYEEETAKRLKALTKENLEGQTKIPVHYILRTGEVTGLAVGSVAWDEEKLEQYIKEGKETEAGKKIVEFFRLPGLLSDAEEGEEGGLQKVFRAYTESDGYRGFLASLEPERLFREIINDKVIGGSGLVSYVELVGTAGPEAGACLKAHGQKEICLRDTRGLLDDGQEELDQWRQELEKAAREKEAGAGTGGNGTSDGEQAQFLLDRRGVRGIDGCIFLHSGDTNSLRAGTVGELYGPLMGQMVRNCPMFSVVRTDRLVDVYEKKGPELCYREAVNKESLGKNFSGYLNNSKYLRSYGLEERDGDYKSAIARSHYMDLALPDITGCQEEAQWIYQKAAVGLLDVVLEKVCDYLERLEKGKAFLGKKRERLQAVAKEVFEETFREKLAWYEGRLAYRTCYTAYYTEYLGTRILAARDYRGGIAGPMGGLTVSGGQGRRITPVLLLEEGYAVLERIAEEAADRLEPDVWKELGDEKAVQAMKRDVTETLRSRIAEDYERLYCTRRMIPRRYLELAFEKKQKEWREPGRYAEELAAKLAPVIESRAPETTASGWKEENRYAAVTGALLYQTICKYSNEG